jgi:hypothetical protein
MTDRSWTLLPLVAGVLAGGLWNAANLWCLSKAVRVWLSPQRTRRQQIGWFVVKFPLLYAVAFALLQIPGLSLIGFGIGFTVVLAVVVLRTLKAKHLPASSPAHGS